MIVPPTWGAALAHELHAFLGREVLEHDVEAGEILGHRLQAALDEHGLAVEDVDLGIGFLAVDQEGHADLLHPREHAADLGEIGDARGRVGRGIRRIHLDRGEDAVAEARLDIVGVGGVGEIAGHQRLEGRAFGQRLQHALAIGGGVLGRRDGRQEVRHHDRAAEIARREGERGFQHRAVAHVQMPVVGFADCDAIGHRLLRFAIPHPNRFALTRYSGSTSPQGGGEIRCYTPAPNPARTTRRRSARRSCGLGRSAPTRRRRCPRWDR